MHAASAGGVSLKIAFLRCIGGISGDMLIGAVVDAGVEVDVLNDALACLGIDGLSISAASAERGAVSGKLVTVTTPADYGRLRIDDFLRIVRGSRLPGPVIEESSAILRRLGQAEAAVHGSGPDGAELHELGDLDTLVDVVAGPAGLRALGVDRLYCSPLPSGSGFVRTEHGRLPVPSPATAALMAMANAPVVPPPGNVPDAGEMVTPTGAAIVTTLAAFSQPPMRVERVGYGLGSRNSPHYPNAAALWVGEAMEDTRTTGLRLLETNVDDMSAEMLAYAQERLFDLGARDVWFTPVQMKKSRPATMLSALVDDDLEAAAVDVIMRETSTLGVRVRPVTRYEAEREAVEFESSLGAVSVKVKRLGGSAVAVHPEYESCRRVALDRSEPLQDVYRIVQAEAAAKLLQRSALSGDVLE